MTEVLAAQINSEAAGATRRLRTVADPEVQRALSLGSRQVSSFGRLALLREQATIDVRKGGSKLSEDGARIDAGNWEEFGECRQDSPDNMFVLGAEQNIAKKICAMCIVRDECLSEALDNQINWGVWGGMTERERRALLRRSKKMAPGA